MISKILVLLGSFIILVANSSALWSFFSARSAMKNAAAEGIGNFASAFDAAYYSVAFSFVGIFILFIGCILLFMPSKSKI